MAKRRRIPEIPPGPIISSFTDGPHVDLHRLFANEAVEKLELAIADAIEAGHQRLLIVHGKGSGTLRREVRHFLKYHPRVVTYQHAPVQDGGEGVTIATLRTSRRS